MSFRGAGDTVASILNLLLALIGLVTFLAPTLIARFIAWIRESTNGEVQSIDALAKSVQGFAWIPVVLIVLLSVLRKNYKSYEDVRATAQRLHERLTGHILAEVSAWPSRPLAP